MRAWPARNVHYDGAWQLRLTAGHPSKRLNSITVLDRSDISDIEVRFEKAARRYTAFGRPVLVRETPLTPPPLIEFLTERSSESFDETIVLTCNLRDFEATDIVERLPSQDVGRFVGALLSINPVDGLTKAGLAEVVTAIKPVHGFFISDDDDNRPLAAGLCVQDFDMAGIESLVVAPSARRTGLGYGLMASMLHWAKLKEARFAWLQVHADNAPALNLYEKLGFKEVYRYRYWRQKAD